MSELSTSRSVIAGDAYVNDHHLRARQRLYAYQKPQYDLPAIVLDHLSDTAGVVVDIGCGNGRYTYRLRTRRPDLTTIGLDISAGILRTVPAPAVAADAVALPFLNGIADAVLAMHMIYHITDIDAGLAEIARILRPGGILIASTNASDDKHELDDLWSSAAADVLHIPSGPRRISLSSRFPLDHAADRLNSYFTHVEIIELTGTIVVTQPDPVLAHFASYRPWAHQAGVPFELTLHRVWQRLTMLLGREGRFTISCHSGIITGTNQ